MRQKAKVTAPSATEAQECMKDYTVANSSLKKIEAEIELKVQKVREKYQPKIESLSTDKEENFQQLQAYALENREALFSKKKSLEWVHGVLGFRTGTPKVAKKMGITWAAMLDLFKSQSKTEFIREKQELDKDRILSSRDDEAIMKELEGLGIRITQDETFYVEPKEENLIAGR